MPSISHEVVVLHKAVIQVTTLSGKPLHGRVVSITKQIVMCQICAQWVPPNRTTPYHSQTSNSGNFKKWGAAPLIYYNYIINEKYPFCS